MSKITQDILFYFVVFHFCLDAKVEQKIKPVFDEAKN